MRTGSGAVHAAVGTADVPTALAGLVDLPDYHYLDAFTLEFPGAGRWTADRWTRAMFEDDRPLLVRAVSRGLLGVMLNRPGPPGRIGDYTISASGDHLVRGDTASALTEDQVVVAVGADEVSLVTAVRYRSPAGRRVWGVLQRLHRSFAPTVMRYAAAHIGP